MIEALLDYVLNAAWQAPLVGLGAFVLVRAARLSPRDRCAAFSAFVPLAVLLPAFRIQAGLVRRRSVFGAQGVEGPGAARGPGSNPEASVFMSHQAGVLLATVAVVLVAVFAVRLLVGVRSARRLARRSSPIAVAPGITARLRAFAARSGVAPPEIRCSSEIAGPAVVGCSPGVILVPDGFEQVAEAQACAALLHECAHVVRRDYALNLALELISLPLCWHPVVHLLKSRIRATREIVCDGLAAAETGSSTLYARCLVDLASSMQAAAPRRGRLALALLGRGDLEARVRELLKPKGGLVRPGGLRTWIVTAAVIVLVGTPVAMVHVAPMLVRDDASHLVRHVAVFSRDVPTVRTIQPRRAGAAPRRARRWADLRSLPSSRRVHPGRGWSGATRLASAEAKSIPPVAAPPGEDVLTPIAPEPVELVLRSAPLGLGFTVAVYLTDGPCAEAAKMSGALGQAVADPPRAEPPSGNDAQLANDPDRPLQPTGSSSLDGRSAVPPASPSAACLKAAAVASRRRALGAA